MILEIKNIKKNSGETFLEFYPKNFYQNYLINSPEKFKSDPKIFCKTLRNLLLNHYFYFNYDF